MHAHLDDLAPLSSRSDAGHIPETFRQWVVARTPLDGQLSADCFERRRVAMPSVGPGEALVRVRLINIHSATRLRMALGLTPVGETDRRTYACAEVMVSRDPTFQVGDTIACQAGWQEYQIIRSADLPVGFNPPGESVRSLNKTCSPWLYVFRPAMARQWPSDVLMDVFGTSGMTAYFGMRENGPLTPNDHVAVAATAGSVGALVAQLAKAAGSRVIGFARGKERGRALIDMFGIDGCIDYTSDRLDAELEAAFPQGIDVFSDGVGGGFTETVTKRMNRRGRLFSYGAAAASYAANLSAASKRPSLREHYGISAAVEKTIAERQLKSAVWTVDTFYGDRLQAEDDLSRLMQASQLRPHNQLVHGFDRVPDAIVELYRKPHAGKLQISFH